MLIQRYLKNTKDASQSLTLIIKLIYKSDKKKNTNELSCKHKYRNVALQRVCNAKF